MRIPSLWAERWGKEVAAIQVGRKTKANFLWILEHMQRPNYMEKNRLPDYMERERSPDISVEHGLHLPYQWAMCHINDHPQPEARAGVGACVLRPIQSVCQATSQGSVS